MRLSYADILGDGKRHTIHAEITTDHPASHYGQPVIVLDDGGALDATSWVLLNYQVVKASSAELEMIKNWISLVYLMSGVAVQVDYVTVAWAAEQTGFSAAHIRRLIGQGKIPAMKKGHEWMINNADVELIQRRRAPKRKRDDDSADGE